MSRNNRIYYDVLDILLTDITNTIIYIYYLQTYTHMQPNFSTSHGDSFI